jgi:hypothetical protein
MAAMMPAVAAMMSAVAAMMSAVAAMMPAVAAMMSAVAALCLRRNVSRGHFITSFCTLLRSLLK